MLESSGGSELLAGFCSGVYDGQPQPQGALFLTRL